MSATSINMESAEEERKHTKKGINWPLSLLSCLMLIVGLIGTPLLIRLYYLHGGKRRWMPTCMQTAGFPMILFPGVYLLLRSRAQKVPLSTFLMEPVLFAWSGVLGLCIGLSNFLYAMGISYLPVSTSSLLFSTQLVFIALFGRFIVNQKLTPYSINAIVMLSLGSAMLSLRTNGDRPAGVTNAQYIGGILITLGSAAVVGIIWPCTEYSYAKAKRPVNYGVVLQFQLNFAFFATIFSIIGMLVSKDFQAIGKEAAEYGLGRDMYYVLLFAIAVVCQLSFLGAVSAIYCIGCLFNGIMCAVILPVTEVASVIAYHESFNGEKAMSLALCLWGFISYFYGEYKMNKKTECVDPKEQMLVLND